MNPDSLEAALAGLPLGPYRYFDRTGSTQVEAAAWANSGAPHLALVVADEQVAGRGRFDRRWFTPPRAALAFSLVLRPGEAVNSSPGFIQQYTALGALALSSALAPYGLAPEIKWPNDVLLERKKTAGILVEAYWQADRLEALIMGIGVNVTPASVPPPEPLIYPATCVECALGRAVDRLALLRSILEQLFAWQARLGSPEFWQAWSDRLAFKGEWVRLEGSDTGLAEGLVQGLNQDGGLVLRGRDGREYTMYSGELRLRPIDFSGAGDHAVREE